MTARQYDGYTDLLLDKIQIISKIDIQQMKHLILKQHLYIFKVTAFQHATVQRCNKKTVCR